MDTSSSFMNQVRVFASNRLHRPSPFSASGKAPWSMQRAQVQELLARMGTGDDLVLSAPQVKDWFYPLRTNVMW